MNASYAIGEVDKETGLLLNLSQKSNIFVGGDQTPTPTSLIKNCEEVGLFEDLQHVNPFEETFRRACEQSVYQSPTIHPNSAALNTNEDSLHTPQVFPQFDIAAEGGICDVENIDKQTLDTPVLCKDVQATKQISTGTNEPTTGKEQNDVEINSCVAEKAITPQVIPSISFMPPNVIQLQPQVITLTIPASNTHISQENTTLVAENIKSRPLLLPKLTENTRVHATESVNVSATAIQCRTSIESMRSSSSSVNEPSSASLTPTSQLPIKERLKAILNQNSKAHQVSEWSSINHKFHLNKSKYKLPKACSSNDAMERRRAASSRYRHKMRDEHKELIKRNCELKTENEKLKQRIKHLEMEMRKLQQSNTEQPLKTSNSSLPAQLHIPASTIHLLMNIPKRKSVMLTVHHFLHATLAANTMDV
uniref:BZIP domain-containing protein n=1 Tax=Glossina pallidipes TaxID=7398 RepID=A0A1A9ZXA6_GLOPL